MKNALALMVAAAALALAGCEDTKTQKAEVADNPAAAASEKQAASPSPAAADPANAHVYTFGPENSKIGFKGAKVTGSHLGGFNKFDGEIVVPGEQPKSGSIKLTIDASSIYTDSEKLTGHLKSADFFDVEKFPTASFQSTSVEQGEVGKHKVTGDLTMHGVTKQVTFPATITLAGDTVKANSEFSINRKDFGIVYPGMPDDLIRDDVIITFDINAAKKGAAAGTGTTAETEATGTVGSK